MVSSSGMNSATTMLLALVPDGGHIVTTTDCYRRTRQFIQTVLPRMGISVSAKESKVSAKCRKWFQRSVSTCAGFFEGLSQFYACGLLEVGGLD